MAVANGYAEPDQTREECFMNGNRCPHARAAHSRVRAFSLIELLIVILVIAILVAVLIPVLNRARQSAMTAKCLSNLAQIGKAHLAYASQNDNMAVPPETMMGPLVSDSAVREVWTTALVAGGFVAGYPSVSDVDAPAIRNTIFDCPSSPNEVEAYGTAVDAYSVKVPSPLDSGNQVGWRFKSTATGNYVDSWYIMPSRSATTGNDFVSFRYAAEPNTLPNSKRSDLRLAIGSQRQPSELMLILEGIGGMNMGAVTAGTTGYPAGLSGTNVGRNRIAARHGDNSKLAAARTNVLFFDGHAETVDRKDLPYAISDGTSLVAQRGWTNLPGNRRFK